MLTIEMDNFDLGQICRSGQCFRMDQIGDDRYRVIAGDKYLELTQERGIVNFFCPEEDFIFFWIRYFDLDCDYSEYINMINPRDKYLKMQYLWIYTKGWPDQRNSSGYLRDRKRNCRMPDHNRCNIYE